MHYIEIAWLALGDHEYWSQSRGQPVDMPLGIRGGGIGLGGMGALNFGQ